MLISHKKETLFLPKHEGRKLCSENGFRQPRQLDPRSLSLLKEKTLTFPLGGGDVRLRQSPIRLFEEFTAETSKQLIT